METWSNDVQTILKQGESNWNSIREMIGYGKKSKKSAKGNVNIQSSHETFTP